MIKDGNRLTLNLSGAVLILATLGLLGYVVYGIINTEVPLGNRDAVMLVLGGLMAKYSDLISFFFGSSHTNKQQAETLDKMAETAKTATQAAVPSSPTIPLQPGETVTVEGKE